MKFWGDEHGDCQSSNILRDQKVREERNAHLNIIWQLVISYILYIKKAQPISSIKIIYVTSKR
jgi:hypothetical protein